MSSLLDEAIVDAKALREAVLKNAEASLLEAYAPKIEEAVVKLLEQDPAAAALPMDIGAPPADIGAMPGGLGVAPEPMDAETGATFTAGEEEDLGDIKYGALTELDDDSSLDDQVEIDITRGELQTMLESITKDIEELEEMHCGGGGKRDEDDDDSEDHFAQSEVDALMEIDEDVLEAFELEEAGGPDKYIVKPGDTLSNIAGQYGVSVEYLVGYQLAQENEIGSDPSDIKVGQVILVPGEREAAAEEAASYERMGREHMAGSMGEGQKSTEKYDDDPALKGDQDELPDALQKGIIQAKEGVSLSEENIDEIVESLVVDMMPVKRGWAGTPESEMQFNEKLAAAMAQSDKFKEEKEELLKVGKELAESIEKHQHVNSKLKDVVDALKERLDEVNLSNARLLYTNRVLKESSLNERQKETIVEALSNAGSVNEAKVIFETLQSTVGSSIKKGPKSLSEAVSRPSTILPRSKSQSTQPDSFTDRMKLLAGIKN